MLRRQVRCRQRCGGLRVPGARAAQVTGTATATATPSSSARATALTTRTRCCSYASRARRRGSQERNTGSLIGAKTKRECRLDM